MTIRGSIRVDGTKKIRQELLRRSRTMPKRIVVPATKAVAEDGASYARRNRGFINRTYKLVRSIGAEQSRDRRGRFISGFSLVMGNARAYYARFIEFGTQFITARKTLQRAARYLRSRRVGKAANAARRNFKRAAR